MITELRVQNFKSWQDTGALQFAPLTGLFGANSSGKSSVLQVLLLLKQTVERPPDWNEPLYFGDEASLVNLGSFDDVIHQHNSNLSLDLSVSWKLPEKMNIERNSTDRLSLSTSIDKKNEHPDLANFCYMNRQKRAIERTQQGHRFEFPDVRYPNGIPDPSVGSMTVDPFRCYGVVEPAGRPHERLEVFLTCKVAFENLFSQIRYLGPLREYPRRDYTWEESHPEDVGLHGEKMISALLSSRVQNRSTDEQIMKWLQKLELIYSYALNSTSNTEQNYEFLVKQYKGGPEVGLTDVGFGVSQVLPLLTLCYYADEGSILILEQPEAHLHPKVQSELADVLIDVVKNRNVQIILESHSEHLLLRLMRRIAEEGISADDTALYFCQINDGTSEIERLKVDEYGNIRNWPQNFFGDEMGDLVEKTKAEMKRRKANK